MRPFPEAILLATAIRLCLGAWSTWTLSPISTLPDGALWIDRDELSKSAYSVHPNGSERTRQPQPLEESVASLREIGRPEKSGEPEDGPRRKGPPSETGTETETRGEEKIGLPRIALCCPPSNRLVHGVCVPENGSFKFPVVHEAGSLAPTGRRVDRDNFEFFVWDPCEGGQRYRLVPEEYVEDSYFLLDNGSIYRDIPNEARVNDHYCLAIVDNYTYDAVVCFEDGEGEEDDDDRAQGKIAVAFPVGLTISVPFLLATFLVYSILPELRNMHGRTLRCYVGSLLVAYVVLAVIQMSPQERISDTLCIAFAFAIHFSFLASFFWLNVMCFDIWWTFGGFRALQGSVKQRERKKFILYSIYAWSSASILTGVCAIMDSIPDVPKYFKPQFGVHSCWFPTDAAKALYFYGPMGVTVVCNICLFISTAVKIVRHKKDTARHLKGTDSKRHDDNKQWFNLYLKLFIVMGINWSMEIVSWLCEDSSTIFTYIWYVTDLTNTLQGVIIFLIFVWKDKIKRLLLKRFGCRRSDVLSRNSTRSVYHSSASRTCTTAVPLQEKPIRLPTTIESTAETITEARPVALRSPSDDDCA